MTYIRLASSLRKYVSVIVYPPPPLISLVSVGPSHHALASIWEFIGRINKYLDDEKPWALAKDPDQRERLGHCLREGLEALRFAAILLQAFMPHTSARMWEDLGLEGEPSLRDKGPRWNGLPEGGSTSLSGPLFPRIEVKD